LLKNPFLGNTNLPRSIFVWDKHNGINAQGKSGRDFHVSFNLADKQLYFEAAKIQQLLISASND
jgi:hypothetical protein